MIYAFLFLAAFLYFVADRKIRLSILPGIFVTLMACYAMLYRLAVFNYTRSGYKTIPSYLLDLTNGNIRTALGISVIPLLAVVGTIIVVAFLFLGKAIGRVIFNPAKDGKGYIVVSRIIYIAASVLLVISGLYYTIIPCMMMKATPETGYTISSITRIFGAFAFNNETAIPFGSILIFIGVLCTILICTKIPFFRTLKAEDPKKIERLKKSGKNPLSIIGFILTGLGTLGVLIITIICLPQWGRVFFFDGYTYTQIISGFLLLFLILGVVFLGFGFGRIKYQQKAGTRIAFLVASLVMLVLSMSEIIWLVSNAISAYLLKY